MLSGPLVHNQAMTQNHDQAAPSREESIATVARLIKGIRFAMLTFHNAEGHLHAQPMTTQEQDFDGDLWFIASKDSDLVRSLQSNKAVNVSYAQEGKGYVSAYGDAELVEDRAKLDELWSDFYKAYFPEGKEDPNVQLLKVAVHGAHYWESDGKVSNIFQVAKALVTGATPHMGESGSVKL